MLQLKRAYLAPLMACLFGGGYNHPPHWVEPGPHKWGMALAVLTCASNSKGVSHLYPDGNQACSSGGHAPHLPSR